MTGIKFRKSQFRPNPFASSVDRIESSLGYVPGNVRLVLWAVNCACGPWGLSVFDEVSRAYVERNK